MSEDKTFEVSMHRIEDFEFEATFDWEHLPALTLDEPEPMGHRRGPNAARLLGAAVGNCLSASLLFCLEKSRVEVRGIETRVAGVIERNERGRLRIQRLDVEIRLDAEGDAQRIARCLGLFEDYCIVTASVRQGIEVGVKVTDREGQELAAAASAER